MYNCCRFLPFFCLFDSSVSLRASVGIHSVWYCVLEPRTSLHVDVNDSFIACHFTLMVFSISSSCRTLNLLKTSILNSCCLVVSFSSIVVSFHGRWLLPAVQFLYSLSFSLTIKKWWFEQHLLHASHRHLGEIF